MELESTSHRAIIGDARDMPVADNSVELVVTSPPYPMVGIWDDLFANLNSDVDELLSEGDGQAAFEAMHSSLDEVWDQLSEVVVEGGIVCINIGDAVRTVGDNFHRYPNHSRITTAMEERGFRSLPSIHWRKPTSSPTKFLGSGMRPPNAYPTLETEYILVFRKGEASRDLSGKADNRDASAYFYEERNKWFSDMWDEIQGVAQETSVDSEAVDREHIAKYPLAVPYRLINMFSIYGDTVLDPFAGSGTTLISAAICGRNSIGIELNEDLVRQTITYRFQRGLSEKSRLVHLQRLQRHDEGVQEAIGTEKEPTFESVHYPTWVKTQGERYLKLFDVSEVETSQKLSKAVFDVEHGEFDYEGELSKRNLGGDQSELEEFMAEETSESVEGQAHSS